jgi:hypothetical protein
LDATAFEVLTRAAGGEDKVAAWCEDLLPGDQKLKEPKEQPSGSNGQGQSGPPTSSTGNGGSQGERAP